MLTPKDLARAQDDAKLSSPERTEEAILRAKRNIERFQGAIKAEEAAIEYLEAVKYYQGEIRAQETKDGKEG